ncbi:hypothetical protein PCYB_007780 [Plasmodium cynomolgi strain B]|uniref:CYIR protein n=1 Tax=Plasmodium cynomolgi (strain B) TaxID=1120755 RepID=K6V121_PLACD|nr:hypothetical protein PCYB_007780 [Plasmodium cynomolgi strain B]GAB70029.1 hypothetical protein PCYB_007780 [Plasmodium cynomolgi strain B]
MYSNFERGMEGCENIQFYDTLSGYFKESYFEYDLLSISDRILKAVCYIYKEKENKNINFDKELCSYFYYWLGDKIYSLVNDRKEFLRIINTIYEELNENNPKEFNVCDDYISLIDKDTFNKNKLLFDYSKDYEKIELDTVYPNTCNEDYKNYIDKYISAYNEEYSNCYNRERKYGKLAQKFTKIQKQLKLLL